MPKCGIVDLNPHCVSSAIAACGRTGNLKEALRLLELVNRQEGGRIVETCQRAAIQACKRCGDYEMAQQLQAQLEEEEAFNPLQTQTANVDKLLGHSILVNASIGKVRPRRMGVTTFNQTNSGREACSIVTPLAFRNGQSYNRVVIETGRTHQIRVHMQHLGSPLVGDTIYGSTAQKQGKHRPMLHAAELVVPHPISGKTIHLQCPPPTDFEDLAIDIMGWSDYYRTNFGLQRPAMDGA
jgi:hypothetical protein